MSKRVTTRNLMDAMSVEGKASICRRFCVLWWTGPSVWMGSGVCPQAEFVWGYVRSAGRGKV